MTMRCIAWRSRERLMAENLSRTGSTVFLKALVFMMFACFAMTTDSVGTVIPSIIDEFDLGMTAAGSFHRSEEHTSDLQSLMRISYAVFCLQQKTNIKRT